MNEIRTSKSGTTDSRSLVKYRLTVRVGGMLVATVLTCVNLHAQTQLAINSETTAFKPGTDNSWVMSDNPSNAGEKAFPISTSNQAGVETFFESDAYPMLQAEPRAHRRHSGVHAPDCPTDACQGCGNQYFLQFEAMWLSREGDNSFTLSQGNPLTDYEFELGGRFTIGQRYDCLEGIEFVYAGPFDWQRTSLVNGAGLNSRFVTDGGYVASQIDTFNDSIRHLQAHRSSLQSFEINRRWYAWDVMSTMFGFRGFDFEEDYAFDTVAPDLGAGFFRQSVDNFLLGAHIGADMYYPISQRLSIGAKGRFGAFANFNEGSTYLANRGLILVATNVKDINISGLVEYGMQARYRILPNVVATAGYEIWYLAHVATVSNQQLTTISPSTGTQVRMNDGAFFQGLTAGLEVRF